MTIAKDIFRQILEDTDGYDSSDQMSYHRPEFEVEITPEDHDEAIVSITVLSDEIMTLLGGAIHVPSHIGRDLHSIEMKLTEIKNKLSNMDNDRSDKYN